MVNENTKKLKNRLGQVNFEVGGLAGDSYNIFLSPIVVDEIMVILKEKGLKFVTVCRPGVYPIIEELDID